MPVDVATTPYLLLYAIGVAERLLGSPSLDDALRTLGPFEDVRGPGLLIAAVDTVLGGQDGRRYGRADSQPISVERREGVTTVVVIGSEGWTLVRYEPGPTWTFDLGGAGRSRSDRRD